MSISNSILAVAALVLSCLAAMTREPAPLDPRPTVEAAPQDPPGCEVDLTRVGSLSDIVSNALTRGLKLPGKDVRTFLDEAKKKYASGAELLKATADRFRVEPDVLAAKVEKYKHCNCSHPVESRLHPLLRVDPKPNAACTVDLENAGVMSDILSNALTRSLDVPEKDVRAFLARSDERFEDGPELFAATTVRFRLREDVLAAKAQEFRHINCTHAGGGGEGGADGDDGDWTPDDGLPVSAFAKNVTLHAVLHEIGHALIREFDLPVLGNEETSAESFATYYLTAHLPDRAPDVLVARATSLMIEANETPEVDWRGEHDDDARRAYHIAALAVAADPVRYAAVADAVGMSPEERKKAGDYGAEILRAWRRVLAPHWMPDGLASTEARVQLDEADGFLQRACGDGLADEIRAAVKRFDWHSQVTVRFVSGNGGAAWNRSGRTVTVHSSYIRRFVRQGEQKGASSPGSK